METQSRGRGLVLPLCVLLLAFGATTAGAGTPEEKCRDTILKEAGKYVKAQTKTLGKCNDSLLKAKDGFNGIQGRGCRDTAGKTQEKLDKARSKFLAKIDKACGGGDKTCDTGDDLALNDATIGWGSTGGFGVGVGAQCPDFEGSGCTNIIRHCGGANSDGEGVTDCVLCIQDEVVEQSIDFLYADLDDAKFGAGDDPEKTINKCQQALVKASAKHILAKSKILGKCWASLNKGKAGFSSTDDDGCVDASGKTATKIDKSESKKIAAICKKCGGPDKACDQVIPTIAGTLVKGAMGEGTGGDLDPLGDIGFGASCPAVSLPYPPNTDCGSLDDLPSGSTNDVIENMEELVKCLDCVLEFKVDCSDRSLVPSHEALPEECNACLVDTDGDPCPTALQVTANPLATSLDSGWTGLSHDFDVPSNGRLTVGISNCDGTNRPTCGECDISGPIPNAGGPQFNNQRCRSDNSITCTADSDCPVTDNCVFYFGVALPLSSGSVPICVSNEIVGSVTGTADLDLGTSESNINLVSRVHTGVSNARPCPNCEYDAVDDRFECTAGQRPGLECAVHSNSSIFGALSYDCPPDSAGNIGNLPISLNPSTGSKTLTMSAATPSCNAGGWTTFKCFCSTCTTVAGEPCNADSDCPLTATCGGKRCQGGANAGDPCVANSECTGGGSCGVPGEPSAANQCEDGICTPVPGDTDSVDEGECLAGPSEGICSIDRWQGCNADFQCAPPTCPECQPGNTCIFPNQQCYTASMIGDDVEAEGMADPGCGDTANPKLVSFFCIRQTSAAATNKVGGLPGLGRIGLQVEAVYQ